YAGSAYVFNYTATSNNTAVYCRSDAGFPSGNTGTLTTNRPNARFYIIGGGNDTNSVGFVNVLSPVDTIPAYQSIPIQVVIKNKGLHNLMSCNIDWTLNGVSQPTYNWTGNLMEDFTDTVILDYFTPIQDKDYEFTFRVSMPNNAYDSTTYDDTLSCVSFAQYDGYNLSMDKFISPFNNTYEVCYNKTAEVKIRLKNTGNYAILLSNNPLTLYYNVSGPVNFQTYRVITQGVIPVGTRDFVVDSLLDILFPGTYHIEVISQCGLDTITFDDTLRMQYEVKRILLPYDNDFSATLTDIDFNSTSDTVFWEQDLQPDIIPVYGNATLHFNSDLSEGESANAVLHAFDLQGCLMPTLEFWFAHDNTNPSDSDKVVVKISTNGGNTYSPIATVYRYNALFTTPGWQYYEIDLSAYSSESCVKIAFEAHSEGGGDMSIDRILISAEQEMSVELIIPQLKDMVACDLDQKEIKVRITNNTITPVDFDQQLSLLTLEASGAQTATYVDTLSGQIPAYTSSEFIIDNQFDFTLAGIYDFKAYINHIDVNTLNDTSIAGITIMPDVSLVSIDSIGEKAINQSVYLSVEISNTGNIAIQQIPLHLQIDGVVDVYDTADVLLAAGEDTVYTLKNAYKVPIEPTYQLMIAADLDCDIDAFNDSLNMEGKVSKPTLKVTKILKPNKDVCDKGLTEIFPQISIHNSGNPETDVVVYFIADKNDSLIASFVDTIALITNGNNNYNFKESYFVPNWETNTTYNVKAYIYSPTYALVQTACVIFNDVSIALADETSLNLGQNIPNPAQSTTSIPFYIPLEGNVLFTITSVSGQTLYTENLEVTAGSHMLEINIDMLANGIYYYSMQYKGQRLIKKMTIQK
ncbi:MAG: T9SS type A sorting domain-containing protein, partial [Bacteroidales bacterium]|nr:T9SS type A sorting domain-containing protein [Bacteroidales bacterium]